MTTDRAAIRAAILDYFEGWYDGDAERMTRALAPEFVKRSVGPGDEGTPAIDTLTAAQMIAATKSGLGRARGRGDRAITIAVDAVSGGIATARVTSADYVEYVHLAAISGGWRIVNALWRFADGHGPRR
jgi:hypothetical protein